MFNIGRTQILEVRHIKYILILQQFVSELSPPGFVYAYSKLQFRNKRVWATGWLFWQTLVARFGLSSLQVLQNIRETILLLDRKYIRYDFTPLILIGSLV